MSDFIYLPGFKKPMRAEQGIAPIEPTRLPLGLSMLLAVIFSLGLWAMIFLAARAVLRAL